MRKVMMYLNGVKSVCLMLLAYLALSVVATSCNQDEFENYEPEKKREFTKAELIEQALSRIPQTRTENPNAVTMVTIQDTIHIQCTATETMIVCLDGEEYPVPITETNKDYKYTISTGFPSHSITIKGGKNAIRSLNVDNCGLISLNVSGNTNLADLSCSNNNLDEIGLTNCSLESLDISNNEFSSIDLTPFRMLNIFQADRNRLKNIDVSENIYLWDLFIGNNQITNIDVSKNLELFTLELANNPIRNLDVTKNIHLALLDVSFTPITNLDLSKNPFLWSITLENTPIDTLNNLPICDTSFTAFSSLAKLNIAYTAFDALDLTKNRNMIEIDISGTDITQLNISSNALLERLCATRSSLTNLIYGNLSNLYYLHIERTPFENERLNMSSLSLTLPPRTEMDPGHLYTYSSSINDIQLLQNFAEINWLINR